MSKHSGLCIAAWVMAAILSIRGGSALVNAAEASKWPLTPGIVTESDARWIQVKRSVRLPMLSYQLHLRYSYSVGSRQFVGTVASFGPWGTEENMNPFGARLAAALPPGSKVNVYFNPADPARSVIDPHVRPSSWTALLMGMGLAIAGFRFAALAEKEKRLAAGAPSMAPK